MYKDKEKQKQAQKEANQRYRANKKASGLRTEQKDRDTRPVIPSKVIPSVIPEPGQPDCECQPTSLHAMKSTAWLCLTMQTMWVQV